MGIVDALEQAKSIFKDYGVIVLDEQKQINQQGNYLIFRSCEPANNDHLKKCNFSLYLAFSSLQGSDGAYAKIDELQMAIVKQQEQFKIIKNGTIKLDNVQGNLYIFSLEFALFAQYWQDK